jgi:hypothetical protein
VTVGNTIENPGLTPKEAATGQLPNTKKAIKKANESLTKKAAVG